MSQDSIAIQLFLTANVLFAILTLMCKATQQHLAGTEVLAYQGTNDDKVHNGPR